MSDQENVRLVKSSDPSLRLIKSKIRPRKVKTPRWPDYERVKMETVVTFGTTVFMRKDKLALKVVFPTGTVMTFAPLES